MRRCLPWCYKVDCAVVIKDAPLVSLTARKQNDRWRHHRSPPPQFRYGTGGEENILQSPALVVSAATANKTFGPTDLTSTYSVCTRRVFGGIEHRTQAFRSGVRCSNPRPMNKGLGLNPGEDMDVCKCIVPLRHGGDLNSRRAASPLVWLVEGVERREAPDHPQVASLKIGEETSQIVLSPV
ncbi:uncharacterized protein TNCV_3276651 [Trichonephila clavipes]|nr:uncharacterized protein TNCV_3276651 [Trichonephila clavipes]